MTPPPARLLGDWRYGFGYIEVWFRRPIDLDADVVCYALAYALVDWPDGGIAYVVDDETDRPIDWPDADERKAIYAAAEEAL